MIDKLSNIFFPEAQKRLNALNYGTRLAHYTTTDNAFKIIRGRQFWVRDATTMNDFSEIQHGMRCLDAVYKDPEIKPRLVAALDSIYPGCANECQQAFNMDSNQWRAQTYIGSFSEHYVSEDGLGRLSMWRAYGGKNGVALVFHPRAIIMQSNPLGAVMSPVAYETTDSFKNLFIEVVEKIETNKNFIRSLGRENVKQYLASALKYAVLSTKHKGFSEEKEWRLIVDSSSTNNSLVGKSAEVINGHPQIVYKIKLENHITKQPANLSIPHILDRIIIGPTAYPESARQALVALLIEQGINENEASAKVVVSDIPLRQ